MGPLETIFSFIFVMTLLSIPIIALIKRKPKFDDKRIDELERKYRDLELKLLERNNELLELRNSLIFMQRLIENKKE